MIYLTAQPDRIKFYWQLLVQLENFRQVGIELRDVHVLVACQGAPSKEMLSLARTSGARVFFYHHSGDYRYLPAVQPHIIAQHYEQLPELQHEYVFFLDCDVIFSRLPDFSLMAEDGTWYLSQTWVQSPDNCYINSRYLRRHSELAFQEMAQVVGIAADRVIRNDAVSGGGHYLLTGVDHYFWQKVEMDSMAMYVWYRRREAEYKRLNPACDVQIWCAGMWSLLWNAWLYGHRTAVHPELAFAWATYHLQDFDRYTMLHMAGVIGGVQAQEPGPHFDKMAYDTRAPFADDFSWINPNSITNKYVQLFKSVPCN